MADFWYCMINGKNVGPITSNQLKEMARSGEIGPDDAVRREDVYRWMSAKRIEDLFDGDSHVMPPTPSAIVPNPCVPPQYAKPSTDGSVAGIYLGCGCITMLAAMVVFFWVVMPNLAVQRSNTAIQAKISALTAKQQIESQQWDEARNTLEAVIGTGNADKSTLAQAHELSAQVNDKIRQEESRQADLIPKGQEPQEEKAAEQQVAQQRKMESVVSERQPQITNSVGDLLSVAKSRITSGDLITARSLLSDYLRQSSASKKEEAQQLFTELLTATSDTVIAEKIESMSDEALKQVRVTGTIDGQELTNPTLNAIYRQSIKRFLDDVLARRVKERRAEEQARLQQEINDWRRREPERQAEKDLEAKRSAAEKDAVERQDKKSHPTIVAFRDLVDFPEKYSNAYVFLKDVELHTPKHWTRNRDVGVYEAAVEKDGKRTSWLSAVNGECMFVIDEEWGRGIDFDESDDFTYDLACHVSQMKMHGKDCYVARIYSITRRVYALSDTALMGVLLGTYDSLESVQRAVNKTFMDPNF